MRLVQTGAASTDSSEEEEEGNDEYDYADNFLAREDEEEEQPDDSDGERERKRRKRKRRRERALQLDNEDYELLEENQVTVRISVVGGCQHSRVYAPDLFALSQ